MKNLLINFCIGFTITTFISILLFGQFTNWNSNQLEVWGYVIGAVMLGCMINAYFKK